MFFFSNRLDDHVIHINLDLFVYHVVKDSSHSPLVSSFCIDQPKRHYSEIESAPRCNERCLFSILWRHLDLVVTGETIHEGENFGFCGTVDQYVNVRQWKIIFGTNFVQVTVINTHSDFTVLL